MALPKKYLEAILPFLHGYLSQDDFHQMILLCYESPAQSSKRFVDKTILFIREHFAHQRRINHILYNPYLNISFNQCIGTSKSPVSEWLNASDWREWD